MFGGLEDNKKVSQSGWNYTKGPRGQYKLEQPTCQYFKQWISVNFIYNSKGGISIKYLWLTNRKLKYMYRLLLNRRQRPQR